jgi:hypothetical protein
LVNGVGRAFEPATAEPHLRRHGHHVVVEEVRHAPGLRDVTVEAVTLVLGQHGDAQEAAVDQIGECEIDDSVVGTEGHGGLAAVAGERVEPLTFAASEHHAENVGALGHIEPMLPERTREMKGVPAHRPALARMRQKSVPPSEPTDAEKGSEVLI